MKRGPQSIQAPATMLFWTINDAVIERTELLERQFHEIRGSGFGGVAAFVRCTRYNWFDPLARKALTRIGRLCKQYRMKSWIGPDPRFVSRLLIPPSGGLEVLLFGDRARAEIFPNVGVAVEGKFSVRCDISPRHVHTLQEVAIQYAPLRVERVYALRMDDAGPVPVEVKDVTAFARMFHNVKEHYVEAFGELPARFFQGEWRVLPFFRASTNHVDFGSAGQMRQYLEMLHELRNAGCHADGLMWDEPGFTCTYGTLPYSPAIRNAYERSRGKGIERDLWKLAFEAANGSHVPVRVAYYEAIQRILNEANQRFTRLTHRLWAKHTVSGIHDTWHFESADMCDMNHGSLDLWEAAKSKTGGFVDLGGIDKLRDPNSPWNSNLAAMSVICASLGKMSSGGYAYNNLWTVGDDEGQGWQATVMDHCVNTMALFGTRWLAHCYGPVGTIGEEESFLGSPPMPGYPNHSTWHYYPLWNRRLNDHMETVGHHLPVSNVLLLYPIEALYGLSGQSADRAASWVFDLILSLLDNHYHVDVLSPRACKGARWLQGELVLGKARYSAVIAPFATSGEIKSLRLTGKKQAFIQKSVAQVRDRNGEAPFIQSVLTWLDALPAIRPVTAPSGSWVTMTPLQDGMMVTLSPARHGYSYCGSVAYDGKEVEIQEKRSGLSRVLFSRTGQAQMLPDSADASLKR